MWWRACAPTGWPCRCTSAGWRPATPGPTRTSCRTRACRASNGPPGPRGRSGTPAATPWRGSGPRRPRRTPDVRPGPTPTDPVAAAALLAELGVDTAPSTLCRTADEAVAAATAFPVVVKLAEAAHRTELGGVRLDLADADAVRGAAEELLAQGPVLVQRQLSGVEIAVGAVRDPVFGPVVMVGLGGIWVEVLGDVAFAMAPLHRAEARALLSGLRGHALLTGARGGEAVDLDALADVVVAAGNLLLACPDVVELDLNPVLATAEGAVAVDWKIGAAP